MTSIGGFGNNLKNEVFGPLRRPRGSDRKSGSRRFLLLVRSIIIYQLWADAINRVGGDGWTDRQTYTNVNFSDHSKNDE